MTLQMLRHHLFGQELEVVVLAEKRGQVGGNGIDQFQHLLAGGILAHQFAIVAKITEA
jgi:hypothetical protein